MERSTTVLNKEFEEASPNKKRVMIAKDVIKFLDADKIKAYPGTYFEIEEISSNTLKKINEDFQLHELLNEVKGCNLCAIGAVFYSAVINHDNIKVSDICEIGYLDEDGLYVSDYKLTDYLEKFFDIKTLRLIEVAFKGDVVVDVFDDDDAYLITEAQNMFETHRGNSRDRMRAIMMNIIENDGEFKP